MQRSLGHLEPAMLNAGLDRINQILQDGLPHTPSKKDTERHNHLPDIRQIIENVLPGPAVESPISWDFDNSENEPVEHVLPGQAAENPLSWVFDDPEHEPVDMSDERIIARPVASQLRLKIPDL